MEYAITFYDTLKFKSDYIKVLDRGKKNNLRTFVLGLF